MANRSKNEASSSRRSSNRGESIVVDVGKRKGSCGYCKSGGCTSFTHGLWADSITVDDYQDLLDRGWRRSGAFLYKPEMERTCCPSYTIRLKSDDFVPSKEQLRVLRRMQRFLDGMLNVKKPHPLMDEQNTCKQSRGSSSEEVSSLVTKKSCSENSEEKNKEEQLMHYLSNQIDNVVCACAGSGEFPSNIQLPKASVKKVSLAKRKHIEGSESLLYTSSISFQIVAALRRSKSTEKDANELGLSGDAVDQNGQSSELSPNTVAEKLAHSLNQLGEDSGFLIRACNGHLNFYSVTGKPSLGEGSTTVDASRCSPKGSGGKCSFVENNLHLPQKRRRFEIHLKRSSFDPEEYALYRRYQIKVHNEKPDQVKESSYKSFLVDTPIIFVPPSGDSTVPPCGFGSFHQQYVMDGKLVAVGVVDILPRCLSSKYLFWDPDFAFLSLGKYSALKEIDWVKENQLHCPSLQYYYLGYYIHSCRKMRYKAAYHPSELLCPVRYQWVPFAIAKPLLDKKKYVVLSDFPSLQNGECSPNQVPENVIEQQHHDPNQENSSLILSDEDEDMAEAEFDAYDDDSEIETTDLTDDEITDGDVSNTMIDLDGLRFRFRDLQRNIDPEKKDFLELQLHRYKRVVGPKLLERMIYSLRSRTFPEIKVIAKRRHRRMLCLSSFWACFLDPHSK
ncbi:PREDICTED: arginyl-tRNA--protein transferase 2 isoform X2 [Nelumbo nucifera]|uniref:arginyltransferase n=2 Tax=Nelumbo nucifera TaxID=4432 RepID=A0A822Y5U5_NELNU|nr:PREDICTED: arginyl-tRNA--protein transferase 2 isoform X2 [Nelumbo nucifera]DAD26699.1 TPA_asm: hypothetical protein HUJ06_028167 [Nelumbo nucifera]